MKLFLKLGLFLCLLLVSIPVLAEAPKPVLESVPIVKAEKLEAPEISRLIDKYGGDLDTATRNIMLRVVLCESGGNPRAVGKLGERGLVQIYPLAHPDVTLAQAYDPDFAIQFIVKGFKEGHASWWSCMNLI